MDRKARQNLSENRDSRDSRDNDSSPAATAAKNSIADRSNYYKNSVLYSSAT